jgi:translation initiation factor 4G
MRQASGTQGPLAPGNQQTGHLRRESSQSVQSDMNNQGPGPGQGRGGFPPQGGRGRGAFQPQYQQSQMGYPPGGSQFRNTPNQGRGMPPFQSQGRPMPFPNSPHQAARSPALTNSIPGTPNMNQAMPMQNPQQFAFNPTAYMPAPQVVHHPSSSNHASDNAKFNRGKGKKWRGNEQYSNSNRHRSREPSRELFGHEYATHEQMSSERENYGQNDMRNLSMPVERPGRSQIMQHSHVMLPPPAPLERRVSSADQSALPPLPPPLFTVPHMDVSKLDLSPASNDFDRFLTIRQQNFGFPPNGGYDRMGMPLQATPIYYPQMQFMNPPPQSPQPGYQQSNYIPGQYAPQAQPMSRNSSQMSEHRPASGMGQPQTPTIPPSVSHTHTPQPKANPPPSSAFTRPKRTSAAITIKRPDGGEVDLESFKAPASPAPSNRTRTPPVIASTPTPPPKSSTPQHARTDSTAAKTSEKNAEQIKLEMIEKVKKSLVATEPDKTADSQAEADEATKADEAKLKEEEKAKEEAKAAEEAKAKEESDAKAAEDKAKQDEEDELERILREMEEADAKREKEQEELAAKRKAEKEAAEKANAEKRRVAAKENDRKLKEAEREMERLEDEREKKRAEADAKAQGGDKTDSEAEVKKDVRPESKEVSDDKNPPTTPSTLASKLSNLTLGTDSGASTPASDDSMGPPPKVASTEKRGKPAALNLAPLNTKPVEPPQPSAALKSLKSARFLTVLDSNIYPPNINSPNPGLNSAVTTKGKSFKYDKEFLLQFQKVFMEKPSLEFESQIKALIGDGDGGTSARSGSTRTPGGGMGPRQGSRASNPPGAFQMGSFGAAVGGKTLPPGTTSAERFAMSSGVLPRPNLNPMASFNRPGGAGFPGGNAMTRTPSGSNMNPMPHSPRQQSKSQRNNSKRENYQGSNAKQEAQAARMPITVGMEIKPIQISSTGWKPRSIGQSQSVTGVAGPTPGASGGVPGHMEPDMVQRKVKAALNKMTPEKFDKIADQILAIAAQSKDEADGRTLRQVIQLTFEKATDEAHWASMYAKFCKRMLETMSPDIKDESILDKNGHIVSGGNLFRKYLLNRCQEEFERGWKTDLPEKPEGERGEEKTEEAVMLSDEYYIAAAAKRRGLGLVQFIGELYKLSMLTERIMHECVKKLVDYTGIPDEAEIESLTKLLKTIGSNLDSTEKGKPMMDVYFSRIQTMIDTPDLPSRLRFMLMDIVDLRKKRWASKEDNKGPKTLEEVRAEVSSPTSLE